MNKVVTGSLWASTLLLGALAGCGSGSSSGDSTTVTVAGDVPIAYAQRANTMSLNPTNGGPSAPGGDLMIREKSSASALEHNMTAQFTQGRGDVQSPDVSYDGKKIVFSMKCPADNTSKIGDVPACTGAWNIWEYDMTAGGLLNGTFRRLTATGNNDVEPTYLPAGRGYVFTSDRQTKVEPEPGARPDLQGARRVRARDRLQPAHDGRRRRQRDADLVQPEPRPQPDGAPERRHHVLALGPRRRPQPLQDLPRQAGRHRPVRPLRRAQLGQQLPAPARHGPEGPVRGLPRFRPDAAVENARRRRRWSSSTPPTSPSRTRPPIRA